MNSPKTVRFSELEPLQDHEDPDHHSHKGTYWRVFTLFGPFGLWVILVIGIILIVLKHGHADTSTHNSEDPVSCSTSTTTLLSPVYVATAVDRSYNALTSAQSITTIAATTAAPTPAPTSHLGMNTSAAVSMDERSRGGDEAGIAPLLFVPLLIASSGPGSDATSNTQLLKFAVSITTTLICGSYALPLVVFGALSGVLVDPLADPVGLSNTTYSDGITQSIDISVGAACMSDITMTLTSTITVIVATNHSTLSVTFGSTTLHVATKVQDIIPTVVGGDLSSVKSQALGIATELPGIVSSVKSEIAASATALVSSLESKLLPTSSTSSVSASPATYRPPPLSVFALAVALVFVSNPYALPFLLLFGLVRVSGEAVGVLRDVIEVINTDRDKAEGLDILVRSLSAETKIPVMVTTSTGSISPDTLVPAPVDVEPTPTDMLVQHEATMRPSILLLPPLLPHATLQLLQAQTPLLSMLSTDD